LKKLVGSSRDRIVSEVIGRIIMSDRNRGLAWRRRRCRNITEMREQIFHTHAEHNISVLLIIKVVRLIILPTEKSK
jgi:hypothetical protein